MAWVEDPLKKKQEEDAQAAQAGAPPTAAVGAPAPVAAPADAPQVPAQRSPTNFVNFRSYFDANRAGAEAAGNKLAGDVERQAREAQTGLTRAQEQYGKAVDAGSPLGSSRPKTASEQYLENAAAAAPQAAAPGPTARSFADYFNPGPATAAPTPTSDIRGRPTAPAGPGSRQAGTPELLPTMKASALDVDPLAGTKLDESAGAYVNTPGISREEAERRAGLSYSGPSSITEQAGFGDVAGRVTNAAGRANALGSNAGVRGLLEQDLGKSGYSAGQGRLDAALLGQAGGKRFAALRNQFGGMGKGVADAISQSQRDAARARYATAQAAGRYADMVRPEPTTNMLINSPFDGTASGGYQPNNLTPEERAELRRAEQAKVDKKKQEISSMHPLAGLGVGLVDLFSGWQAEDLRKNKKNRPVNNEVVVKTGG